VGSTVDQDVLRAVGRKLDAARACQAELRISDHLLALSYVDGEGTRHQELSPVAELTLQRGWGDRLRSLIRGASTEGWAQRLSGWPWLW
jgi:hypothetical protein